MDTIITVPAGEAHSVPLSTDDAGCLHRWKGRILRGIPADHAAHYRSLFECGLVAALVERRLLVRSWIAPLRLEGYELVVEHERLPWPTYPREWSFRMLRDAALLVLEVNEHSARYGFQTKDCHGYNVLFSSGRPAFVDLGSFTPVRRDCTVLRAYSEFLRSYEYPLRLWRSCGRDLGARTVPRVGSLLSPATYAKVRWPVLRLLAHSTLSRWMERAHAVRTLPHRDEHELVRRFPGWRGSMVRWLRRRRVASAPATIPSLRRRLESLSPPRERTSWSDYQGSMGGNECLTPRFHHVIERLRALDVQSILEIAANQGVLSRAVAAGGRIRVMCTDADASAVDHGYSKAREAGESLDWAVLDPFRPESGPREAPPHERFRADAVVALALTHHLVLTQGLDLSRVLEAIGSFADRYVLVEFMPHGLWDGGAAPCVPGWYTEPWFRQEFERRFELVERTELEPNRVLFIGRVEITRR